MNKSFFKFLILCLLVFFFIIDSTIEYHKFTTTNKLVRYEIEKFNQTKSAEYWTVRIKETILPATGYYLQEPLSKLSYHLFFSDMHKLFGISRKVLANIVTVFYGLGSLPFIWLLSRTEPVDANFRKIACILFQIKNCLDYLDGEIVRNNENKIIEYKGIIDYGQIFDGVFNFVSTFAFLVGSFLYIWKCHKADQSKDYEANIPINISLETPFRKMNKINSKEFKVLVKISIFILYFLIASIGWNYTLTKYTNSILYDKVILTYHHFKVEIFNFKHYF